jgi:hypothetical protein
MAARASVSTVTCTRFLLPSPPISRVTALAAAFPVCGSVATTRSPSWIFSIGLLEPSASNTAVPGAKLLHEAHQDGQPGLHTRTQISAGEALDDVCQSRRSPKRRLGQSNI